MIGDRTGRDDDLGDQAVPLDRVPARGRDRRADHPADQRVRRTRRDAEVPGEQVPDDPARQAGGHHCQRDQLVSTRPLAIVAATASERNAPTRLSTPERPTATRGAERSGGDRGGHRVARVMEAVGEVETQRGHDHQGQQQIVHGHSVSARNLPVERGFGFIPALSAVCHLLFTLLPTSVASRGHRMIDGDPPAGAQPSRADTTAPGPAPAWTASAPVGDQTPERPAHSV